MKWSEVAQTCPTLCDLMDGSLPGSSIHGIFQARILEWVAISFSGGSSQLRDRTRVSCIAGKGFILWAMQSSQLHHSLQTCLRSFQSGYWWTSSQCLRSHRRKALHLAECCKSLTYCSFNLKKFSILPSTLSKPNHTCSVSESCQC